MKKLFNMKSILILAAAAGIAISAGCSHTTFLIGKDGYYTYFGRRNTDLGRELCSSGELAQILQTAAIPEIARDGFIRYICTTEYSRDKVLSIYAFLTPQEKQELWRAFARRGYEVNTVHC